MKVLTHLLLVCCDDFIFKMSLGEVLLNRFSSPARIDPDPSAARWQVSGLVPKCLGSSRQGRGTNETVSILKQGNGLMNVESSA